MTDRVKVDGADRLAATLRSAGRALSQWQETNAAAAELVAADMRQRAPRRSGRLVSSITTQATNEGATIGVGVIYAKVQEFGWPARNIRAQPYALPALTDSQARTVALYATRIDDVVSTVKGI